MTVLLRGSVDDGDGTTARLQVRNGVGEAVADQQWSGPDARDHTVQLIDWIAAHLGEVTLAAVGHRVVHGGHVFSAPVRIDTAILAQLDALIPLAPLHQPATLAPIRALARGRPELVQVACFDTAFHQTIPLPARRYAIPRALEAEGVLRYGFHGLSYEAIAATLAARSAAAMHERIIVGHLGSGASLCALEGLRSVDTTMGFSTLDGLVMGTRPGSLDPGVLLYLQREKGYDLDRLERLLYHESGLLGVSGITPDVEHLLTSSRPEAQEALALFVHSAAGHVTRLATTLGGLDRLVFTGGIGEYVWQIRAMIVARLAWIGAALDLERNRQGRTIISARTSTIKIEVIPTDEERMIARHVAVVLS